MIKTIAVVANRVRAISGPPMATAAGDSGDCLNHRNLYNHKPTNISSSFHCLHLNPVGCEGLQCRRRSVGEDPKPKQAIAGKILHFGRYY